MLGGLQELEFDFVADNPGLTLFHCHQQLHMDFGFMAFLSTMRKRGITWIMRGNYPMTVRFRHRAPRILLLTIWRAPPLVVVISALGGIGLTQAVASPKK